MMATETPTVSTVPTTPVRHYSPLAALLSYLVPGLGQIYQGRVGKGLLFMACLYGMFFYGMHLGEWSNVYLPQPSGRPGLINPAGKMGGWIRWLVAVTNDRLAFAGQFWIGIAAWPAIHHYNHDAKTGPVNVPWRDFQRVPPESPGEIRDALAQIDNLQDMKQKGPLSVEEQQRLNELVVRYNGWKGKSLNELQAQGDKSWDLGLICTVIAGVLNILVIYDAFAGPAQAAAKEEPSQA